MRPTEATSVPGPARKPWRKRVAAAVVLLGGALLVLAAWRAWRPTAPELPSIDFTAIDPEVAEAIQQAEDGVRKSPRSAHAWGRLGVVLFVHEFHAEALPALARAERLAPDEPRWPFFQGVILQRDDLDAALPKLRRALALSREPTLRLRLARALLGQGQYGEAEHLYRQVAQDDPYYSHAQFGLAHVARARGDLAGCLDHLRRAADCPHDPCKSAHSLLAEIYGQSPATQREAQRERDILIRMPDDLPPGEPYLQEALGLRVGLQARIDRARQLGRQHRGREALKLLQETAERYPNSDMAWLQLGSAQILVRDFRGAEKSFLDAARCGPRRYEAFLRLGVARTREREGDPSALARAAEAFRQAIRISPQEHSAHFQLGLCLEGLGQPAAALAAYRETLRCRPDYRPAHRELARLLATAVEQAAVAVSVQHLLGCPAAVDVTALLRREARAQLQRTLQVNPGDRRTRQLLDRLNAEFPG